MTGSPLTQRDTRIAILLASIACLAVLATRASAEPAAPLDDVVRAKLAPMLPAGLDIAQVYLPAALANPDPAAASRAFAAMMTMRRIDIAAIEAAVRG